MRTLFFGEDIWVSNFGKYFTHEVSLHDPDVRDLETNDDTASENIYKELDNGSNFDIMVAHLIGLDHAGHTHGPTHPELERKLLDVERIVENIIEKMDDETTLVAFGDHGMTQDGSHGGSSEIEMRTVLFSYQKQPFPLGRKYRQMYDKFSVLDSMMKQADIAPISSVIANLPTPYSNIGLTHPIFTRSDDLEVAVKDMRANINQILKYLTAFCEQARSEWCFTELEQFEADLREEDNIQAVSDYDLVEKLERMSVVMNERYKRLMTKWISHDLMEMIAGIVLAINLLFVHFFISMS